MSMTTVLFATLMSVATLGLGIVLIIMLPGMMEARQVHRSAGRIKGRR
jgi:hypothetical protein